MVDGASLVLLLNHLANEFYELSRLCWAVVCCRMSPSQKAEVRQEKMGAVGRGGEVEIFCTERAIKWMVTGGGDGDMI